LNSDSGLITVVAGTATAISMNQQPGSASSVDSVFDTQPKVFVQDAQGNAVSGVTVTASK
jgi:hypothetical protein